MKKIILLFALSALTIQAQTNSQNVSAKYNIKNPSESKGLTKVKITEKKLPSLVIADKGKALVPIVCPRQRYYRQVARLLKKYLDKATGASFAITGKIPVKGKAIFIGNCDLPEVRKIYQKAQLMPDESFIIESIPWGIVLAGKDDFCKNRLVKKKEMSAFDRKQSRGTLFAMTDFLERLIGIRWYFPGLGIHIPDLKKAKVSIPPLAYADTPVFDFRDLGYGGGVDFKLLKASSKNVKEWNLLSRLADVNMKESWHTDSHWHKVFGKSHPEYFALRKDGTRAIGDRGRFSAYRCYSNEEGFKAHIKAIDDYYKTGKGTELFLTKRFAPNKKYIHWGIADGFRGCECEQCRKLMNNDSEYGMYSPLVWRYVLKLARECKKRWPDKILKIHLYGRYREIPEFFIKENPGNVLICPVRPSQDRSSAGFLKESKIYADSVKQTEFLRKLSPEKPYIWLHYPHSPGMHSGQHVPCLAPNFYKKFIRENQDKISGMLFNGHRTFSYSLNSLVLYIMYKISWNPDIDVDACIDEYCQTLFGPAAPEIKEYYTTIIDRWENLKWKKLPKQGPLDGKLPLSCYWKETYPKKLREKLEKLLLEALSKTQKGSIYFDRVKFLVDGTTPFFEQGRFYDLGKKFQYKCYKWAPDKVDGVMRGWYPAGLKSVRLHRNDNGKLQEDKLKGQISMSHDEKNLYIAGKIISDDDFVTKGGKQKRDSDIWAHDSLEIFLCTEQPGMEEAGLNQTSQYHQFIIDPHESVWDGYKFRSMNNGLNYKIDVHVLNRKNKLWFEIAIPFSELKCVPPKAGGKWYINFYWNKNRNGKVLSYTWAGTGRHHDPSRFGILEFSDEKPRKRKLKSK